MEKKETKKGTTLFDKNEVLTILRFGVEELFKEDKNEEEARKKLENVDIDEILERAEKVESKETKSIKTREISYFPTEVKGYEIKGQQAATNTYHNQTKRDHLLGNKS